MHKVHDCTQTQLIVCIVRVLNEVQVLDTAAPGGDPESAGGKVSHFNTIVEHVDHISKYEFELLTRTQP